VRAVETLPCRVAVKYHNVTPPKFFAAGSEVAKGCAEGVRQVARLARTRAHLWADSEFNAADFRAVAPTREVAELPPFHHGEHLIRTDPDLRSVGGLDDWGTNLLLVGRVVPNKNLPLAIRSLAEYRRRFDTHARLVVVGDRPVPDHAKEVDKLARDLGQDGHTLITGKVTTAQLKALYLTADALLVTSLHEGFCVPLVEAMGLRRPVVAVPTAAVPFTGGDAASYCEADPTALAEAVHRVLSDSVGREAQVARGRDRYEAKFTPAAIGARFEALFDRLVGA
jgi:glycosyltransferase involved in cell wall biosynthesis